MDSRDDLITVVAMVSRLAALKITTIQDIDELLSILACYTGSRKSSFREKGKRLTLDYC